MQNLASLSYSGLRSSLTSDSAEETQTNRDIRPWTTDAISDAPETDWGGFGALGVRWSLRPSGSGPREGLLTLGFASVSRAWMAKRDSEYRPHRFLRGLVPAMSGKQSTKSSVVWSTVSFFASSSWAVFEAPLRSMLHGFPWRGGVVGGNSGLPCQLS